MTGKVTMKEQKELNALIKKISEKSAVEANRFCGRMEQVAKEEDLPMPALMAYATAHLGTLYTHAYVEASAEQRVLLNTLQRMAVEVTEDLVKLSQEQLKKSETPIILPHER